jgi:hypothetical protein
MVRIVAGLIALFWTVVLVRWVRDPARAVAFAESLPPPIPRLSHRQLIAVALAGIVAGLMVVVWTYLVFTT